MTKKVSNYRVTKCLLLSLSFMIIFIALLTTDSYAAVESTRNIYSSDGSMKFDFTGLELDITHEYEYGLTKTAAEAVATWYLITEYTDTTATIDLIIKTTNIRSVINAVDTGYITIRDKTDGNTIIMPPYDVDLMMPYLRVTDYSLIPNGKQFSSTNPISVALRNKNSSTAHYQYEKITDQDIINEYKKIKVANGSIFEIESMLKTIPPNTNWTTWGYWNAYTVDGMNGVGYTERNINVSDSGLYYMWIYFSGNNLKDMYGYIIVDNLQPEIAVASISLPATRNVEIGKTITLTPTFNPTNATNKIVTWSSSDESVVAVNNAGVITGIKVGSAVITVTTQDGNKVATSTVTVVSPNSSNNNVNNNNSNDNNANSGSTTNNGKDNTVAPGKLPETGQTLIYGGGILICIFAIMSYKKYKSIIVR